MSINFSDGRSLRDKARLNASLARDLADSFGGDIADYLKRLNKNLKRQIVIGSAKRRRQDNVIIPDTAAIYDFPHASGDPAGFVPDVAAPPTAHEAANRRMA